MVSEELLLVERLGIGGAAFILVYLLLRRMQEKAFELSDKILTLAEGVIIENTKTLQEMRGGLEAHMKQKEPIIAEIRDCKRDRDEILRRIESKIA